LAPKVLLTPSVLVPAMSATATRVQSKDRLFCQWPPVGMPRKVSVTQVTERPARPASSAEMPPEKFDTSSHSPTASRMRASWVPFSSYQAVTWSFASPWVARYIDPRAALKFW
jgi:hypothetical protein